MEKLNSHGPNILERFKILINRICEFAGISAVPVENGSEIFEEQEAAITAAHTTEFIIK